MPARGPMPRALGKTQSRFGREDLLARGRVALVGHDYGLVELRK